MQISALTAVAGEVGPAPQPDTGSLAGDLRVIQRHQARLIGSPLFREVIRALVTHLSTDEAAAQAYLRDFVGRRREAVHVALARAIERGEIGRRPDLDLVYDTLTGPLFYRAVARRQRLSTTFADALVDVAVAVALMTDQSQRS